MAAVQSAGLHRGAAPNGEGEEGSAGRLAATVPGSQILQTTTTLFTLLLGSLRLASAGDALAGSYDPGLVALSALIAILAAGAALDLANRVTAARGRARALWLGGGAFAMGSGIWCMHYVGMLAFRLPVPVLYDAPTVGASLVAAVLASVVALWVASGRALGLRRVLAGSAVMGIGIAAMHYIGMAAMRMPARLSYDPVLFTLSVVVAVVVAAVALVLAFHLRSDAIRAWDWRRIGSMLLMGAAIPAMHYTGMAAARFTAATAPLGLEIRHAFSISSLGTAAIAGSTLLVLVLAIGTALVDRRLAAQAATTARLAALVQALRESEQRYRRIFQAAAVSIWEQDYTQVKLAIERLKAEGVRDFRAYCAAHPEFSREARAMVRTLDVNDATLRLLDAGSRDELWASLDRVFTPATDDAIGWLTAIAEERTVFATEGVLHTLQGEPRTVLLAVTFPPPPDRLESVLMSVMDITERKRAEAAAAKLERALRRARERGLEARFAAVLEERTRLAREIHDTLLQGFTGVGLQLLAAARQVNGPPRAVAALRDVLAVAQKTLTEARRAIWDLRAPDGMRGDFPAALRTAAQETARSAGLALDYHLTGPPRDLASDVEEVLSRVAQEAIVNVVKHAAARTIHLSLAYGASGVRLAVRDDGQGFVVDPKFHSYRGHWGLLGMHERATEIGATLAVHSAPGRGTEVLLRLPYVAPKRARLIGGRSVSPGE